MDGSAGFNEYMERLRSETVIKLKALTKHHLQNQNQRRPSVMLGFFFLLSTHLSASVIIPKF